MKTYAELVRDDILQMERWPPSIRSSSRVTCWNENETKQSSRWHTDRQLKWACHLLICFSSTPAWVPISVLLFLSLSLTFLYLSFRQTHGWAVVLLFPVIMPFFSHHLWLSFLLFGSVFLHSNFFSPAAGCYYLKWSCRKKMKISDSFLSLNILIMSVSLLPLCIILPPVFEMIIKQLKKMFCSHFYVLNKHMSSDFWRPPCWNVSWI